MSIMPPLIRYICLIVLMVLRPIQQLFSHVGTRLPGSNQYKAEDEMSCSRRGLLNSVISASYCMACVSVRDDNPRALAFYCMCMHAFALCAL